MPLPPPSEPMPEPDVEPPIFLDCMVRGCQGIRTDPKWDAWGFWFCDCSYVDWHMMWYPWPNPSRKWIVCNDKRKHKLSTRPWPIGYMTPATGSPMWKAPAPPPTPKDSHAPCPSATSAHAVAGAEAAVDARDARPEDQRGPTEPKSSGAAASTDTPQADVDDGLHPAVRQLTARSLDSGHPSTPKARSPTEPAFPDARSPPRAKSKVCPSQFEGRSGGDSLEAPTPCPTELLSKAILAPAKTGTFWLSHVSAARLAMASKWILEALFDPKYYLYDFSQLDRPHHEIILSIQQTGNLDLGISSLPPPPPSPMLVSLAWVVGFVEVVFWRMQTSA